MVRDADGGVADTPVEVQQTDPAPPMLRQPVDAPPPLTRPSEIDAICALRDERAARLRAVQSPGRFRTRARSWAGRVSGRADRRLMDALAGAVDALVAQCDAITDRVNVQLERDTEVTSAFGQEISRLRAEVTHLRDAVNPSERPGG